MSDDEIIKLWRQGYTIEQIVYKFPSSMLRKDEKAMWNLYNRVETLVFNYMQEK